jgi:hypothetical protein
VWCGGGGGGVGVGVGVGGGKNNNILSRWDSVFNTSAAHMYNQTFTPPHMCACLKPGLGLSSAFFVFSEMRGFCSSLY